MKKTMIALATLLTFSASGVSAAEISVAVAANFTAPIKEISAITKRKAVIRFWPLSVQPVPSTLRLKMVLRIRFCLPRMQRHLRRLSTKVSVSTLNPTPSESWFSGAQQIISSNKIPTSSSPTPLRKSRLPIRS